MTATVSPELKKLALNLKTEYPRSPRATLGGYVIVARILDKCRATINGTHDEYNYDCPLDRFFFDFTGINADEFKNFVATGASDEQVAQWIGEKSSIKDKAAIVKWNNEWRYKTLDRLPERIQLFFEETFFEKNPMIRILYFFDCLDYDEKRLSL